MPAEDERMVVNLLEDGITNEVLWQRRKDSLMVGSLMLPDGRALSYHIDGDLALRKPVVLLIHGMLNSRLLWLAEEPPSRCTYISVDRPGYADSSCPGPNYGYTAFARDIEALLDHLGVEETIVIGHSTGGPYALAVASALGAQRVACVACLCGDTEYANPSSETPVDPVAKDLLCCLARPLRRYWCWCLVPMLLRFGCLFFWIMRRLAAQRTQGFLWALMTTEERAMWEDRGGDNFFRYSLVESMRNSVLPTPARGAAGGIVTDFRLERAGRFDFDPSGIECRVILWSCENDAPCLAPTIFNHTTLCPGSELHILPGLGHLAMLRPDVLQQLIDRTLEVACRTGFTKP